MSNQSGTSLNLTDGFGATALWGRRAAPIQAAPDRAPSMARDGYTRQRHPDERLTPPAYAALRSSCTRKR
ncbi:MAG: hypothetical protein JWM80_5225 [Cyanobacteria bacterium RYN_339]|nr:hypothetical protein [Cyanobacteria bacterium RYN_339]